MPKVLVNILIFLNYIRCSPHIFLFYFHKNRSIIRADTFRWLKLYGRKYTQLTGFIYLLGLYPEFRNVFYNRIGITKYFLNFICPKLSTLTIGTKNIGEGLYIQHGFATGIGAKSIGKNCWINQQVSIGHFHGGCPTILDNVTIRTGAVIIGEITIGNNVVIGANATVFTDVPDNCTVFPPHSKVMHWNDKNMVTGSKYLQ